MLKILEPGAVLPQRQLLGVPDIKGASNQLRLPHFSAGHFVFINYNCLCLNQKNKDNKTERWINKIYSFCGIIDYSIPVHMSLTHSKTSLSCIDRFIVFKEWISRTPLQNSLWAPKLQKLSLMRICQ